MADYEEHPSKVAAWREGHFIVLLDAAAVDCTIWFGIAPDESGEVRWEGLLGRRLGQDHALVCAVPFWLFDLNLGDEVRTITCQALRHGDHPRIGQLHVPRVSDRRRRRRVIAISCPPDQAQGVADDLASRERRGELHYETGRTTAAPAD